MTYEEREQIFSKDYLNVDDVMKLLGTDKSTAYKTIKRIRLNSKDRLGVNGKISVEDYIDFFDFDFRRFLPRPVVKEQGGEANVG